LKLKYGQLHLSFGFKFNLRRYTMENFKLGKLKQICKYLFASNPTLAPHLVGSAG